MFFSKTLRQLCAFLLSLAIFLVPSLAQAWSQTPHSQINAEALRLFLRQAKGKEKFRLGPLAPGAFQEPLRGVGVASSSLKVGDFVSREANLSMQRWIIMGGDWADEPHLFSSVRHFYDPLHAQEGYVAYLTDQSWAHGLYDSPQIDARSWGLHHPENPFSFLVALSSYKAALEVQEDAPLPPQISMPHFKTNLNLTAKDHEDQRHLYLSRAYRALGESMHMLGDMTQPAHVRNDSHPMDEPIEISIFPEHVRAAAAAPFIDSHIRPYLESAGGTLQEPLELFHQVASFINKTFYAMDTIYDGPSGALPNNRQKPYPAPQFKDLEEVKTTVQGFLMPRSVSKFYGLFDAIKRVPMAQERLSFHWFDPEQSFLGGFDPLKEKVARGVAGRLGRLGRYHVPHAFAPFQGVVLLPLAIYACADLLELFFPTLELKAEFEESELLPEREPETDSPENAEEVPITVIEIESSMEHLREKDPAWKTADLTIHYSGPAELVVLEKEKKEGREREKEIYTRKLLFRKGALEQIETLKGAFEEAPLRLYAAPSGATLTEEQAFYELKHNQTALIRIEGGSRIFKSPSWTLEQEAEVSILPPRIVILELMEGRADQDEMEFQAVATPKGLYLFEWDFDDGSELLKDRPQPGKPSKVTHLYQGLKPGQEYAPRVKLFDHEENFLTEDAISISVIQGAERHFFENRTFWMTGSPFANDPSVTFPEVPLKLGLAVTGLSGDILPKTPEAKRLEKMTGAVENAQEAMKEQMLQEMAKMGVTLTESQLQEALGQALGLSGLGKPGEDPRTVPGRKVLVSGYAVPGEPLTLTLSVALGRIPPVRVSMPETPPLEGRVKVIRWFFTTGFLTSSEQRGSSGRASLSWIPGKDAKVPESFSVDLMMHYSLDFYKRGTQEPWLDSGVPVRYDNLSVSFPVGICFVPLWQEKKP